MLKRAPSVYVPVEPEDDGIALPAILSLIVHGSILAFILFSHRVANIDTQPTIETSLITPQELASIQAGIAANREAAVAGGSMSSDEYSDDLAETNPEQEYSFEDVKESSENVATQVFKRTVSVFTKSDDPADDFDVPENNGHDADFDEKSREYDEAQAAFQRQLDKEMQEKQENYAKYLAEREAAEQEQLKAYQQKRSTPPKIEKPQRVERTIPAPTKSSNDSTSDQQTQRFDLGRDGQPMAGASKSYDSSSASGGSSSSSSANISGALVSLIKPYWNPPVGRVGTTVSANVTVDSSGNVLSVTANTSDEPLKQSLESAVRNASPLTPVVGTNNRKLKLNFVVE